MRPVGVFCLRQTCICIFNDRRTWYKKMSKQVPYVSHLNVMTDDRSRCSPIDSNIFIAPLPRISSQIIDISIDNSTHPPLETSHEFSIDVRSAFRGNSYILTLPYFKVIDYIHIGLRPDIISMQYQNRFSAAELDSNSIFHKFLDRGTDIYIVFEFDEVVELNNPD